MTRPAAASSELSPEEAQSKREYHLALSAQRAAAQQRAEEEVDCADAGMVTLFLPGD